MSAVPVKKERSKSNGSMVLFRNPQPKTLNPHRSPMTISERKKEIRRRRKRAEKLTKLKTRLGKATKSEQVEIARKVRDMTPGAEVVIANWGLAAVDR
jgi:hypothetical protein